MYRWQRAQERRRPPPGRRRECIRERAGSLLPGEVGGLGVVGAANLGTDCAVFEAVQSTLRKQYVVTYASRAPGAALTQLRRRCRPARPWRSCGGSRCTACRTCSC